MAAMPVAVVPVSLERRSAHELAAALLWRSHGAVGPAGAAGVLVAAQADAATAAGRDLPAAEDPGARLEARGDAASKPLVADAAQAADGGPHRRRPCRTGLQPARKTTGRRCGPCAGHRQ